jgi:heme exporter protein B
MNAISVIIRRELLCVWRSGGQWIMGAVFMSAFLALCGIALGGQISELRRLGSPLIWLAVLFAMLLSFQSLFQDDFRQGSLTQLRLHGVSPLALCLGKWAAFLLTGFLPLWLITPLVATLFGLSLNATGAVMFTLALTAPALAAYVTLAGALLCGRQGAAFLAILLVMPFLIPLLIFGLEATQAVLTSGWTAPEIRILFGLTLLSIAIGLPASSAALRINLEPS